MNETDSGHVFGTSNFQLDSPIKFVQAPELEGFDVEETGYEEMLEFFRERLKLFVVTVLPVGRVEGVEVWRVRCLAARRWVEIELPFHNHIDMNEFYGMVGDYLVARQSRCWVDYNMAAAMETVMGRVTLAGDALTPPEMMTLMARIHDWSETVRINSLAHPH